MMLIKVKLSSYLGREATESYIDSVATVSGCEKVSFEVTDAGAVAVDGVLKLLFESEINSTKLTAIKTVLSTAFAVEEFTVV